MRIGRSEEQIVGPVGFHPEMPGFRQVVRFIDVGSRRSGIQKADANAENEIQDGGKPFSRR